MNIEQFKQALPKLFNAGITPLIVGHRGVGKSQCVKQYAIDGGHMVEDFRLGTAADAGDLTGLLDVENSNDYCKFKMPERIYRLKTFAENNPDKKAILFLDEINRGTKDLIQAVFQIVLDNELNGVKFPSNFHCIAAQNPSTDEYNVLDFDDSAFLDRFCHIKFEPTVKDWINYAKEAGFSPSIFDFIADQPEMLRPELSDFSVTKNIKPSGRSWEASNKLLMEFGEDAASSDPIFAELLMGLLGTEGASSYIGYLKSYDKAIQADDVLNNYSKVRKTVKKYSTDKHDRTDLLSNVGDKILEELNKIKQINKTQEKNLVNFLMDIKKDLGQGILLKAIRIDSFMNTESCPDGGLTCKTKNPLAKKLIDHFKEA